MSTLDMIRDTLQALAEDAEYPMSGGVYYGACNKQSLPEWNYFVFNRRRESASGRKSYTDYYEVHIVHEDYVMEGYELDVIRALKAAIPGLSASEDNDITYDYSMKGDTQVVIEICNITLKRARKVDDAG